MMSGSARVARVRIKVLALLMESLNWTSVLQSSRWLWAYEVERERDQEHDEASHPKRTRPAPHFQIIHKKPPFFAHSLFCGRCFLILRETRTR